jgi:hypothetical protein
VYISGAAPERITAYNKRVVLKERGVQFNEAGRTIAALKMHMRIL